MQYYLKQKGSWARQHFVQKNHTFVNNFVGIHWADLLLIYSKSDAFST